MVECQPSSSLGRHTQGDYSLRLVPATSDRGKSHRMKWPFVLQNLVAGPTLVPATSPTNSNQFEFLGQVPATCSSKRFM